MKEKIMDIAESQLKSGGYSRLNFSDIASKLSTTRANLHYHYKNKETLALAVTRRYVKDYRNMLNQLSKNHESDFVDLVYAMEDIIWQHITKNIGEGSCVCTPLLRNKLSVPPALFELALDHHEYILDFLRKEIQKSKNSAAISDTRQTEVIAREGFVSLFGTLHMAALIKPGESRENSLFGSLKSWVDSLK